MRDLQIIVGDCREALKSLPDESIQCCVTSPPYFGLRDYGHDGQIGLEDSLDEYIAQLVLVFEEVRRVLKQDGSPWLNLGDSYAGSRCGPDTGSTLNGSRRNQNEAKAAKRKMIASRRRDNAPVPRSDIAVLGLKPKDLVGVPWRVAFALQESSWYLRQDIIWSKPNPMPESVTDRCTKAHEYIFLLTKSPRYHFDHHAIKELSDYPRGPGNIKPNQAIPLQRAGDNSNLRGSLHKIGAREQRNKRSVWWVATKPYHGAHFATSPHDLIEPCILAGCPEGGTVLDPFGGSGTTAGVALALKRKAVMIELNPEYAELMEDRINQVKRIYMPNHHADQQAMEI